MTYGRSADLDEQLLQTLRDAAAEVDPEPEGITTAALAAFTWRTVDAELAALTYDSALDEGLMTGVRGEGARLLTFEGGGLTVEIEMTSDRRMVGQLVPPTSMDVEVRYPSGRSVVHADEMGRFAAGPVPGGPMSLRCKKTGDPPRWLETRWVLV